MHWTKPLSRSNQLSPCHGCHSPWSRLQPLAERISSGRIVSGRILETDWMTSSSTMKQRRSFTGMLASNNFFLMISVRKHHITFMSNSGGLTSTHATVSLLHCPLCAKPLPNGLSAAFHQRLASLIMDCGISLQNINHITPDFQLKGISIRSQWDFCQTAHTQVFDGGYPKLDDADFNALRNRCLHHIDKILDIFARPKDNPCFLVVCDAQGKARSRNVLMAVQASLEYSVGVG